MKSKIYSSDFVKTSSKGQLWLPAIFFIGFLIAFPVVELMTFGRWAGLGYEAAQINMLYENLWRDGLLQSGYVVVAAAAFLNGLNSFWYLYSSRKTDFYHCLPIRRRSMFLHRTYVGILYYLIPYLVMEFAAICIGAMRGFFSLELMRMAVVMLLFHLLLYLFLFFTVVLIICMTGNLLMGAVALFGVIAYIPLLAHMALGYQRYFFQTSYYEEGGIVQQFYNYGSPVRLGLGAISDYAQKKAGGLLLLLILCTVFVAVAACLAYVKRPSENAGKSMVYAWTEPVARFLAVIPAGLGVGFIFYVTPGDSTRVFWWIFGLVIGTVLAHGALEVLFHLDFRKAFSHKLQLGAALLLTAVCASGIYFDWIGYDTYLPAQEKIQELKMRFSSVTNENTPYVAKQEDSEYYEIAQQWAEEEWDFLQVEDSSAVYKAMEEIVDGQEDISDPCATVPTEYVLKSGKKVYRQYKVDRQKLENLLTAVYAELPFRERKYAFLKIDSKYLQWINGSFYNSEDYALFQNEKEKYGQLAEALRQDIEEAKAEDFLEIPCAFLSFQYEGLPVEPSVELLSAGLADTSYYYGSVNVYPAFKRTVALLKETGYPVSMEDVQLEYAKIADYSDHTQTVTEEELLRVTEPEELEELKEGLVSYQLVPSWLEVVKDISLNVKTKEGLQEVPMCLQKDKVPEFVEEYLKGKRGEQDGENDTAG